MYLKQVFVAVLLSTLLGCSSGPTPRKKKESTVRSTELTVNKHYDNSAQAKEYRAIQNDYSNRIWDRVLLKSRAFLEKYPRSTYADQIHHTRALAFIAQKQYSLALDSLQKTLELASDYELQSMATYNLAFVHFELGHFSETEVFIGKIQPEQLDLPNREKYYVLRAKLAKQNQQPEQALREILLAMKTVEAQEKTLSEQDAMVSFLKEQAALVQDTKALEKIQNEFSTPFLNTFVSKKEEKPRVDLVSEPGKIGVLLTLSGKQALFGQKALQGMRLAIEKLAQRTEHSNIALELVVADDQGDAATAAREFDRLVIDQHVIAVIGPLISKLVDPVSKRAQELNVPLITLTQKESQSSEYVLNAGMTPQSQVQEIVHFAMKKKGFKRFAVMAPASNFGKDYAKMFWDAVEKEGGEIRGYELYPENETDFRSHIDKLVGLAWPEARALELEELRALKNQNIALLQSKKVRNTKKYDRMFELKPIVDFDAVFIPEEPRVLGQILPTFAYRDADNIQFLGINTWNSNELLARAGQFVERAVFVDGYFPNDNSPKVKSFIADFQSKYQFMPTSIEALAYDASYLVGFLLKHQKIESKSDLLHKIQSLRSFDGVCGNMSYEDGRLKRNLHFLTVKSGRIEELTL